jgi:hypothetical protein
VTKAFAPHVDNNSRRTICRIPPLWKYSTSAAASIRSSVSKDQEASDRQCSAGRAPSPVLPAQTGIDVESARFDLQSNGPSFEGGALI